MPQHAIVAGSMSFKKEAAQALLLLSKGWWSHWQPLARALRLHGVVAPVVGWLAGAAGAKLELQALICFGL